MPCIAYVDPNSFFPGIYHHYTCTCMNYSHTSQLKKITASLLRGEYECMPVGFQYDGDDSTARGLLWLTSELVSAVALDIA